MKRLISLVALLVICVMAFAQEKLTSHAQMSIERLKAMMERRAAVSNDKGIANAPAKQDVVLILKVAESNAKETFAQIREAGAEIKAKLDRQVIVSVPIDKVEAINEIVGVERIDAGHKPSYKTDVARNETGVSLLNGPQVPDASTNYTGKGVTICVIDAGFDFQHAAFKDAEGNSRIKAVYLMGDENGHKFTVHDPEIGDITYPGSIYDTPELIAQLTTDDSLEYHGTHTAGIAAGSISPMGFGGMAPEADLVIIPLSDEQILDLYDEVEGDLNKILEMAVFFAADYARATGTPMVLSCSANNHIGPHDGTGTVPEAIKAVSSSLIPVFAVGNEGDYPIHLYRKFTNKLNKSFSTVLAMIPDEEDENQYIMEDEVVCYTRAGEEISVQVSLCKVNAIGSLSKVWSTDITTATKGCEPSSIIINSLNDSQLATYYDGIVTIYANDLGDGRLFFSTGMSGIIKGLYLFQLTVSGSVGTELDMWDNLAGFNIFGLSGNVIGDSNMSGGDWTSVSDVISVGAYCTNLEYRCYDGSKEDESEFQYVVGEYAPFSSYGTMMNGVAQPVVSAPGVNIVSSWNKYFIPSGDTVLDNMQWMGSPYGSESGTSMSCPMVSGIIALWLEANPELTIEDLKDVMRETCVNDESTAKSPIRWGYGKINAAKGIEYINSHNSIRGVQDLEVAKTGIIYDLSGRRVTNPSHGIYIKDGQKFVVK